MKISNYTKKYYIFGYRSGSTSWTGSYHGRHSIRSSCFRHEVPLATTRRFVTLSVSNCSCVPSPTSVLVRSIRSCLSPPGHATTLNVGRDHVAQPRSPAWRRCGTRVRVSVVDSGCSVTPSPADRDSDTPSALFSTARRRTPSPRNGSLRIGSSPTSARTGPPLQNP